MRHGMAWELIHVDGLDDIGIGRNRGHRYPVWPVRHPSQVEGRSLNCRVSIDS